MKRALAFLFVCLLAGVFVGCLGYSAHAAAYDGASAAPGDAGDGTGTIQGEIDKLVTLALKAAAVAGIAWIGRHVGGWFKSHTQAADAAMKAAEATKSIDTHRLIQMIAAEARSYAEEQLHKGKGGTKLEHGLDYGMTFLRKHGLSGTWAEDELRRVIEAQLGETRTPARPAPKPLPPAA
jgi:IS5 family transposase